tara:strand:- start:1803 stop:2345 length:543 start_codon:yes stop_codon:yes gene_type:complete
MSFKVETEELDEVRSTDEILSYVDSLDESIFPPVKNIKMYYALYLNSEHENEQKIYKAFKKNKSELHTKNIVKLKPLLKGMAGVIRKRLESAVLDTALIATCDIDELRESPDNLKLEPHLLQMQIMTDDDDIYDNKYYIHESGELCRVYAAESIELDSILKIAQDSDYIWVCDKGECSLV